MDIQNNSEVEMYSFNWKYTEPLFKILPEDFHHFTTTEYANLRSLCSDTVIEYAYTTVGRQ